MTGKIIKGIGGFYYVHCDNRGVYECKARGIFRKMDIKPLIGDDVELDILDEENKLANISVILERRNELVRPTVANIDQAVIVFSVSQPEPNFNLLDRFLVMVERQEIDAIICFNKTDIMPPDKVEEIIAIYEKTGYPVYTTSSVKGHGIEGLKQALYGKTTVFAGPSGVGKSSLLNIIQDVIEFETGDVSEKIGRGRHTTRHAELIGFHEDSYVVDTPGFSSLSIEEMEKEELKQYFIEFEQYEDSCRFKGCNHVDEPVCGVKDAVKDGRIHQSRYASYKLLFEEIKEKRRW